MNVRIPFANTINIPLFETTNPGVSLDCAAQLRSVDASVDDGTHLIIAASVNERRFYKAPCYRNSWSSAVSDSFLNGERIVTIKGWT